MARRNKTRFALLGMLALEPMSGYDLRTRIEETISYFWKESYGAIYPTLKDLVAEGLLHREKQTSEGKPDRYIHHITPAGEQALQNWLEERPEQPPLRIELLLKLFFGAEKSMTAMRRHVRRYRRQCSLKVRQLEVLHQLIHSENEGDPRLPWWEMTMRFGILRLRAGVRWADESLAVIDEINKKQHKPRHGLSENEENEL